MEEIEYIFEEVSYIAVYESETFRVLKVGPENALKNEKNKILIDESLALDIIEGKIQLSQCYVDLDSETLELVERQHVTKIDDILHRITEKKWNKNKNLDIFLTYIKNKKTLKIQMTSALGGTKKVNKTNNRKISWFGDTIMNFYFTEYNDPHKLLETISITANDLIGQNFEKTNITLSGRFSVYTRRIFKGYMLEIK
jgi:hypothetical protein